MALSKMSFDIAPKLIFETINNRMYIFNHVKAVFKSHVAMSKCVKGEELEKSRY